ncbi:MAG: stage II sporulation protein M [Planctomycetes bacterium]|nr:stage II sporulation protein M [Planctomycetota bacterium]
MDFEDFVRSRRTRWDRIDTLLKKVEARSTSALSTAEAEELFSLYRFLSSDLNLVQTRSGNPAILEYLEQLVGRAYSVFAVSRRTSIWRLWLRTMRHGFPAELRKQRSMLLVSALAMVAGVFLGYFGTKADRDVAELFVQAEHLEESPAQRVLRLEEEERDRSNLLLTQSGNYALFSTFLFTHNIRVSILCFVLGFTFGIATVGILFFNGAMLGCITALYQMEGVMVFFVAWVGPHGVIELPCVVFAGTAGLVIARAQWRRDRGSLRDQLRHLKPGLIRIVVGASTWLVVAGFIEGGFSQINEPTLSYDTKIAVAGVLLVSFLYYLFIMPVKVPNEDNEDPAIDLISVAAT